MSDRYLFTVFTPTYNRAETLPRTYASLLQQTFRDFEWLVVDDGSTDNTRELLEQWRQEAWFPVRYFWQVNLHKKVAFNRGVREARGELFLPLDSDDEILPETLAILQRVWFEIPAHERHRYSAVTGLCVYPDGQVVGDRYPTSPLDSNSLEVRFKYHIAGEKFGFQRTEILSRFRFPEDVVGHCPEGIVWNSIARSGLKARFINEVLRIYHQTPSSLMHDDLAGIKHAEGLALLARDTLTNDLKWFLYRPLEFLLAAARYTRFNYHLGWQQSGKKYPVRGMAANLLVSLMWPVGFAFFVRDYYRWRRAK